MNNTKKLSAWEKMQLDMVYDDFDKELFDLRVAAKNSIEPQMTSQRNARNF